MGMLHITGSIFLPNIDEVTKNSIQLSIVNDLNSQKIKGKVSDNVVLFENWIFFQISTRRYAIIDQGRFEISLENDRFLLIYELSVKHFLLSIVVVSLILGLFLFWVENFNVMTKVFIIAAFALLGGGGNYLLVYFRNMAFLKRLVKMASATRGKTDGS